MIELVGKYQVDEVKEEIAKETLSQSRRGLKGWRLCDAQATAVVWEPWRYAGMRALMEGF